MMQFIVLGVMAAVGALVWTTVVSTPSNFGAISEQNAEIRTTVIEMRNSLNALTLKLDAGQKETANQNARLSTVETQITTGKESLDDVTQRVKDLERKQ